MLTDTCSGGGGRDDLETLRRAVPLWRSDYAFETTGMQNLTYGLALWIPYFGTGVTALDAYAFRSQMTPALNVMWDLRRKDLDYDSLRHLAGQWRQVADNYYGDFYPLTPYATENDGWAAWQLDRPEVGEGMVQVFRRPQSPFESARLKLQGLDPVGRYTVRNLDVSGQTEMTGRELMDGGLPVSLKQEPEAAIIVYKRGESPRQR
jgi:alpha-galactosidase